MFFSVDFLFENGHCRLVICCGLGGFPYKCFVRFYWRLLLSYYHRRHVEHTYDYMQLHVTILLFLKETSRKSFSAIWAATEASKAAFCAEFHALHSWNNKWSVRFQKSTKIANTRCAPPQAREAPKKYYTLHYTRFKRIQVQVQIQVCHTQRHAAILNFNHAFTSLRRRKAPILKTIRADFAVIWKKIVAYCFS